VDRTAALASRITLTSRATAGEGHVDRALLGSADDLEGHRVAADRADRVVHVVWLADLAACRLDEQVTLGNPGVVGGATGLDLANQDAITVGQAHRAAHSSRDP
jgi:hypothetical protein